MGLLRLTEKCKLISMACHTCQILCVCLSGHLYSSFQEPLKCAGKVKLTSNLLKLMNY